MMRRAKAIVGLLSLAALVGCAGVEPTTKVYTIPQGTIVLTEDLGTIGKACSSVITPGVIVGCYQSIGPEPYFVPLHIWRSVVMNCFIT